MRSIVSDAEGGQDGVRAVVHFFWQGVCEQMAECYEADAMTLIRVYAGSPDDDIAHHGWALAQAIRGKADDLRRWAAEP